MTQKNRVFFGAKSLSLLAMCLLMSSPEVFAEKADFAHSVVANRQQTISGSVKDDGGNPIVGATVLVKGTTRATSTDANGEFSITANNGDVIVIRNLGYLTQEITVSNAQNINISLAPDNANIDEVVVVGYGTQKRANITSAISTVNGDALKNVSPSNLSNAIAGRAPGVKVTGTSGLSGATSKIRFRGSFAEPLFVIDGIVRDKAAFDALEANEVDQMSFLKDAGAAAVYGTRAGNGVVIVTTKKGTVKKPEFNIQSNVAISNPTMTPLADLTTATDELTYQNRVAEFQGLPIPNGEEEFAYFKDKSYSVNDVIWRNPVSHRQSISVSGGSEKITYYNLLSFRNENGSYKSVGHQKFNLRSNVSANITDAFSIDMNISANQQNSNRFYWPFSTSSNDDDFDVSDFYRVTFNWPKMYPFYLTQDGTPSNEPTEYPVQTPMGSWQAWNVIDQVIGDRYIDRKVRQINPILSLNLKLDKLIPGLSTKFVGSYIAEDYLRKRYMSFQKNYTFTSLDPDGNPFIPAPPSEDRINIFTFSQQNPFMDYYTQRKWEYQMNFFINYMQTFGKHDVGATLVFEQGEKGYTNITSTAQSPITALDQMHVYPTDRNFRYTNGLEGIDARQSIIGRFNYAYGSKYLAEASFRYDGAALFPEQKRFGFFPSVSAAWRISEEEFFAGIKDKFSDLKLRFAYGATGNYLDVNGNAINPFSFAEKYATTTGFIFGDRYYNGLAYGSTPNPNITWTRSESYNLGLDYGFINNKLNGSIEVFKRAETNILGPRTVLLPDTYGRALAPENYAARSYKGGEVSVNWNDRVGEVAYGISANLGYAVDQWDVFDEPAAYAEGGLEHFRSRIGRPNNVIYGLNSLGLVRTQAELDDLLAKGFKTYGRDPYLGMILYEDIRGQGYSDTPDGKIDGNDVTLLSTNNSPRWDYGLGLNGSWKGISINALFQGVFNYDRMISNQEGGGMRQHGGTFRPYYPIWADDVWTPENPNAQYPRPIGYNWAESGTNPSSFWMRSGAFFRLKDLNVAYQLPTSFTEKIKMNSINLFFNGTNLFVFSPMTEFHDPEQLNYDSYPLMKTFTFGLDIKF